MTADQVRKLGMLSRRLSDDLMSAALCAREIGELTRGQTDVDAGVDAASGPGTRGPRESELFLRPVLDEATLSVVWRGRTLHLGHTQGFWLLVRLARRDNQYVTHLDLLQEIWDDEFADTGALRAAVRRLRAKLRHGGMGDLSDAITGHHGRYMLDLAAVRARHADVTGAHHRTSPP